ncbi:MAG: Wzz/FepE/Etk N-terminal domain-containing protein, partial [Pseudomonadota bacterium]|nr:Wzz/FepE/Etk N-terminal domain-containing protein [Pseudomonadota bacterium]
MTSVEWSPREPLAMDLGSERESDIDLAAYWNILSQRRWAILGIMALVLAGVLVLTLLTTPIFRASSTIQIQRDVIKVVNSEGITPADSAFDRDFYQTQYELLRSRSLAMRVIQDLQLADNPYYSRALPPKDARASPDQIKARQQSLVGTVLQSLGIEPVRNTQLVNITFDSADAGLAAKVSNAYADAFIASNIEGRFDASAYAKKYLEERLAELKGRLEDTEKELVAFAQDQQIISVGDDKPSLSAQNLSELNNALAKAQGERIKAEAEWLQASAGSGLGLPQVVDSGLVQSLRQARALLDAQYEEKLRVYKSDYPEMLQLRSQIAELDRQIAAEVGNIRASLKSRYQSANQQESLLTARIGTLKGDVLDLASRSIRYNILKREIATNQEIYDGLLQRYKEIGVAGGIGANNISVVDRAEVPGGPYKPNLARNMLMALLMGLGLGILTAFGLNYFDRRINSAKTLEALTGLPALGVVPMLPAGTTPAMASADLRSPFSESYRSVRTALQFSTPHGLPRSLLVTSPGPGEGKSTTATELARNIAQLGRRVVLVDADLRNPSLHKVFEANNGIGLSNVLAGANQLSEAFQSTREPNLTLITSGPHP